LHFAAMADQPALALALVARGANASAQTLFGQTPLHLAAQRNATAAIEALLRDAAVRAVASNPNP
jgi:ankyrin repeat protein